MSCLFTSIVFFLAFNICGHAQENYVSDSVKHWGYEAEYQYGTVMVLDKFQRSYMKDKATWALALKANHVSLPSDSDAYAYSYGYPTFSVVTRFCRNSHASMYRDINYPGGNIQPVDYMSHLGNSLALYGSFSIPLHRDNHWEIDITGNLGIAYSHKKYDKSNNVDNDMIGSHLLFYAGGGVSATYHLSNNWGLKCGVDYWHISNGSTRQPNRSANIIGPIASIVYYPYYNHIITHKYDYIPERFSKYWYINLKAGVGMKTCIEDWDYTQYKVDFNDPDYRTEHFDLYSCCSFQADAMYRYSRIGAIGFGADIQYGSYYNHIRNLDYKKNVTSKYSPWAFSLSAKKTFFYKNISLALGLGIYVYRRMGDFSDRHDPFFFNRIGVHYSIPKLNGLTAGIEVKAHMTKADFTEFVVSYPISIKNKSKE